MKQIKKYIPVALGIPMMCLLCCCSSNTETEKSKIDSSNVTEQDTAEQESVKIENGKISNTSKLKFDNAVVNIPDTAESYHLIFERQDLTKSNLTDTLLKYANSFSNQGSGREYTADDLNYSIDGECGEQLNENFHSANISDDNITVAYNHFSCFYSLNDKSADFSSLSSNGIMDYFSDNTSADIVKNANDVFSQAFDHYSDFFAVSDFEVFPFSYEITDSLSHFRYGVSYKNIPLDTNYYSSMDSDVKDVHMGNNFAEITVDNDKNLLYLLSYYNWKITEKEKCSDVIPIENACEIVDSNLSDDVVFEVSRVDYLYKIDEMLDENEEFMNYWSGIPCWKFTIDVSGIGEYQRLAFFVDASTGEFMTYVIAM